MKIEMPLDSKSKELRDRVADLELKPPAELDQHLVALGYMGQESARRALVLASYRHVRRLRRLFLDRIDASQLGPRQNLLLIGPTGSGKTFLVETLFRDLLKVPTVIVDATTLTEVGYIGSDVSAIPARLVEAAEGDVIWAQAGMICLDEADKLAGSRSNARFAGEGTTKDVSGYGVQRGLLALLSAELTDYAPDYRTKPTPFCLSGITFIGCGAFSGLRAAPEVSRVNVGFGRDRRRLAAPDSTPIEPTEIERFGFLPEFVGRLTRIIELEPLAREALRSILVKNVLRAYQAEFAHEGVDLRVESGVVDQIVTEALRRGHGARGLHSTLAGVLEEAAFHHFGLRRKGSLVLRASEGTVVAERSEAGTATAAQR